jgi:hypothetical protein
MGSKTSRLKMQAPPGQMSVAGGFGSNQGWQDISNNPGDDNQMFADVLKTYVNGNLYVVAAPEGTARIFGIKSRRSTE